MSRINRNKIIYKVSAITIILNVVLTFLKILCGFIGNSFAMISDGIHSASDVLTTIAVMVGAKFSGKKPDSKHQYGHERIECLVSILLSFMLFCTAIYIGYCGVNIIFNLSNSNIIIPSSINIFAALISIILKEYMYRYTKKIADRINSTSLMADAWHHRSDAISSIGSLIGVTGAIFGFKILDPLMSILICLLIIKVSVKLIKTAIDQLIDAAAPEEVEKEIQKIINSYKDIVSIDVLKTRLFGNKIYVDVEVSIDENMSFKSVHTLIHKIHNEIESSNKLIKHCMIHANPKG